MPINEIVETVTSGSLLLAIPLAFAIDLSCEELPEVSCAIHLHVQKREVARNQLTI